MKKIILLIIICSFNLQAQPTGIISSLMDTPVSKFTYGMNECNNYLDKKEYYINKAFEDIIPKKKYGLVISNCDYEFDENEIMLIFFVGEKAQNDGYIPPKTDLKNDDCKQMIDILTNVFLKKHINASGKETITNEIVLSFISRYISTNLDKEVHLKLKDYIYIYITEIIGGKRCKQKLDFDEPVLFFQ